MGCPETNTPKGNWTKDNATREYFLTSCPKGYTLLSVQKTGSKEEQECRACTQSQYILRPDEDDCQTCPPGLICRGDDIVTPKVPHSAWVRNGSVYRLMDCPTGYSVSALGAAGFFDATEQQCLPCGKGEECLSVACTECLPCKPGFYKAAVSTEACLPCPADSFRETEGAQELAACRSCQAKASTRGAVGQSSPSACTCDADYYSAATSLAAGACMTCPKGALCPDRSCALHSKASLLNCPVAGAVVGTWTLNTAIGTYELTGCPPGYSTMSSAKTGLADLQECRACTHGQYILRPDEDYCQTCPPGLICRGDDVVRGRLPGSSWARNGSVFRLVSCPPGYQVSRSISMYVTFDAAVQDCQPCNEGTECTLETACVACSACPAGKFKTVQSPAACQACPPDTYISEVGSKSANDCRPCPDMATTFGLYGQVSKSACKCPSHQLTRLEPSGDQFKCVKCPSGAVCPSDLSCALRAWPTLRCPGPDRMIFGNWSLDPITGQYVLTSCPPGHSRVSNEFSQECKACLPGQYILNPDTDDCMACPRGVFHSLCLVSSQILLRLASTPTSLQL